MKINMFAGVVSLLVALTVLSSGCSSDHSGTPLKVSAFTDSYVSGFNLSNWLENDELGHVQFGKYTRQDFENIKSLGCSVIRVPVRLPLYGSGAPLYLPDPRLLEYLNTICDWAEDLKMHLIIDNHEFYQYGSTPEDVETVLIPAWTNLIKHFKNRSSYIYFELLNEPHGIDFTLWGEIQGRVIKAIRKVDDFHTLIVSGPHWSNLQYIDSLPVYDDPNLIYTFHFYEPQIFTGQGSYWSDPSMADLTNVEFPYNAATMPAMPSVFTGTWLEGEYNNYPTRGTEAYIRSVLQLAVDFKNSRNVPVFCGEIGVYMEFADPDDRNYWHRVVREFLEANGIPLLMWDYKHTMGIFEKNTYGFFEHDLNTNLLVALGMNVPQQTDYVPSVLSNAVSVYSDDFGPNIYNGSSPDAGSYNLYCTDNPGGGQYCLHVYDVNQGDRIDIYFAPFLDLSHLISDGYALRFKVRGDTSGTQFDVRLADSKVSDSDHPWWSRVKLDETMVTWNNQWQTVTLPLTGFAEQGCWDGAWYDPAGLFDWSAIASLHFVFDYHSMTNRNIWLDDIGIVKP